MKRFFVIILFSHFLFSPAHAQQTAVYVDAEKNYRLAVELFDKEKYAAAQKEFDAALKNPAVSEEARANSAFYGAVCAVELQNADAEERLMKYLELYPVSSHYNDGVFAAGKMYFQQKKWKKAIEWFEKTDAKLLSAEQGGEYNYKLGVAYYRVNKFDEANKNFAMVKDGDGKYAAAAQYYYAHSMYMAKNYE